MLLIILSCFMAVLSMNSPLDLPANADVDAVAVIRLTQPRSLPIITLQDQGVRFISEELLGEGNSGKVYKARIEILNGADSLALRLPGSQRPVMLRNGEFVAIKRFHSSVIRRLPNEFKGWATQNAGYYSSVDQRVLIRPYAEGVNLWSHLEELKDPQKILDIIKALEPLQKRTGFHLADVISNPHEPLTPSSFVLVGRSSYKNYPAHYNKEDLARLFGDRFNFEMAVLDPTSYPRGPKLSGFAYRKITRADEQRLADADVAVGLLRNLNSGSERHELVQWYENTLRTNKYGSEDLVQQYMADVRNLANFKELILNPAIERSQEISDAYFNTLSSRHMSDKKAKVILATALKAAERLVVPYKPGGIFTLRNPAARYYEWLDANGYKDAAITYQEHFALAKKAVKVLEGPEFTQESETLVQDYAKNVLGQRGYIAEKDQFLKDYEVALETWKESAAPEKNTALRKQYLAILNRHGMKTRRYMAHLNAGKMMEKNMPALPIPERFPRQGSRAATSVLAHLHP